MIATSHDALDELKGALADVAERDELRRAGRGLLKLASKYDTDEAERTQLRVVR